MGVMQLNEQSNFCSIPAWTKAASSLTSGLSILASDSVANAKKDEISVNVQTMCVPPRENGSSFKQVLPNTEFSRTSTTSKSIVQISDNAFLKPFLLKKRERVPETSISIGKQLEEKAKDV